MGQEAYIGDPEMANRLNAARRHAGFKSARSAALRYGWAPATFAAHETATRYLPEATARIYAKAFAVGEEWLLHGSGSGPAVDPVRAARFEIRRASKAEENRNDPAAVAHRRLRLARRLAGHFSTTAAAAATGLVRTTLSAHETGQNAIGTTMARLYAEAFNVESRWILTGALPSGYPQVLEETIPSLLKTSEISDREARRELEPLLGLVSKVSSFPIKRPRRTSVRRQPPTEEIPEVIAKDLYRSLASGSFKTVGHVYVWTFPKGYVSDVLEAHHPAVVAIAVTVDERLIRRGDRLIVDTTERNPVLGRTYLLVEKTGGIALHCPGRGKSDEAVGARWRVAGRICGKIGVSGLDTCVEDRR